MIRELEPDQIIYRNSVGLKAMMIAEGKADLYVAWSSRIKMWDTCAPTAIISAFGGHVSYVDGSPISFVGSINHKQPILISRFVPDRGLIDTLKALV
jgi:3'(2'), 5'-bisphosphate nucleotidase